jgi:hypothetical protein
MPPTTYQQFPFYARDGSSFSFIRISAPPLPPTQINALNKQYSHDLGVRVRNARYTTEYNCHGLTFVAKLGWFDDVRRMLNCHSYRQIGFCANFDVDHFASDLDVARGDVIVYYDGDPDKPTHTGIVWGKRVVANKLWVTVLSKWGGHSEYFHRHDRVPAIYGKSLEIWTDRGI